MDFKGVLLVFAYCAYTADAISLLVPCFCTLKDEPVCGSDGKTYQNSCRLNCNKYLFGIKVSLVSKGPCPSEVNVVEALCLCPDEDNEVCGSDGITYPNPCKLNCATARDSMLRIEHWGKCDDSPQFGGNDGCVCPFNYAPVCGTDGVTYTNGCTLRCQRSRPGVNIAYEGPCKDNVKVVQSLCLCSDEKDEVCGNDGKTYESPCKLNCATAGNSQLRIEHFGKCNQVKVKEPCLCAFDPTPVCATNGVTYENRCKLNCAKIENPTLNINMVSLGKCGETVMVAVPEFPKPPCTCPRLMSPVCGSDGITYNNECLLKCAGPHIQIARHAPCEFRGY